MIIVDEISKNRKTCLKICFEFQLVMDLLLKAKPSLTKIQSKFQNMFFAFKNNLLLLLSKHLSK